MHFICSFAVMPLNILITVMILINTFGQFLFYSDTQNCKLMNLFLYEFFCIFTVLQGLEFSMLVIQTSDLGSCRIIQSVIYELVVFLT